MKGLLVIVLLVWGFDLNAQSNTSDSVRRKRIEYYFQFQSGALVGCNSCDNGKQVSFTSSFTNGVKIGRKLRVGAGFGFDSYVDWNIVPVFASASWDLLVKKGKKNVLFLQFDYGDGIGGWKPVQYDEYGLTDTQFGKMYSYSIGYRIKYDQLRITLGVGRKTQLVNSYYEYPTYYLRNNLYVPGDPSRTEIKTQMNRFSVFMAIGWK